MMEKKTWRTAALLAGCLVWNIPFAAAMELSLAQAIEMALRDNPSVRIAAKGEEKAAVQLEGAKGQQKPSVSLSTSLGVSDADVGTSRSNSNRVQLSMPLYTGGKNELNIEKAADALASSSLNMGRTQENVKLDVVTAYYKILEAQKLVKVDDETVRNYQEHLKNVQALYSAGSSPRVDVLRSEVELVNAQQNLLKSQNAYEIAVSELKSVIKLEDEEPLVLLDDAADGAFDGTLAECIAIARANRKDLKQYEIAVQQAQKNVGIAESDKKPSVSLAVGNGWEKELFPDHDNYSLSASVSASWNIFDSNVTNSNIKAAEIAVEEAKLELEKQTDAVDLAVRQAYLNMTEARKRFHATEVAVGKAEEDYFIANEKYKSGEGILLDIIDAQLALSTARSNFIQSRYDYATYKATLENAMGMGEEESK